MTNEEEVLYDLTLPVKVTQTKLDYLKSLGRELWEGEPLPIPLTATQEDDNNKRYINKALVQILNDGVEYRKTLKDILGDIEEDDDSGNILH